MTSKYKVAIYLRNSSISANLARCLPEDSVEAIVIHNSEELFSTANDRRIDVIIIQQQLSGFFDGVEILERLVQDLLRPKIILIDRPTSERSRRLGTLGVATVLPPESNVQTIASAVSGLLQAGVTLQVRIPIEARKIVQSCGNLPPLPQLVVKLSSYLRDDSMPVSRLADEILVDPRVTADLLKLTNSSAFASRNKFTKVHDAVKFLGIRRTVATIMSAALSNLQCDFSSRVPADIRDWHARRGILISSTAATFARNLSNVPPETAQVLGLMQDLGILVLAATGEQAYCRLVERFRQIGQLRLSMLERREFHVTHADVSAALMQKWGLPPRLIGIVADHHAEDLRIEQSQEDLGLLHVMRIGEALADLLDVCQPQRLRMLDALLAQYGPGGAAQCKSAVAESVAQAAEAAKLLSVKVPFGQDYAPFVQRICERTNVSVIQNLDESTVIEDFVGSGAQLAAEHLTSVTPEPAVMRRTDSSEPLSRAKSNDQSAATHLAAGYRGTGLVIGDDPQFCMILLRMLNSVGIGALECSSSHDAVKQAEHADFALCDADLRTEKADHVIRSVRQSGFTGPIILIGGDELNESTVTSVDSGIDELLRRPFTRTALLESLQNSGALVMARPTRMRVDAAK